MVKLRHWPTWSSNSTNANPFDWPFSSAAILTSLTGPYWRPTSVIDRFNGVHKAHSFEQFGQIFFGGELAQTRDIYFFLIRVCIRPFLLALRI